MQKASPAHGRGETVGGTFRLEPIQTGRESKGRNPQRGAPEKVPAEGPPRPKDALQASEEDATSQIVGGGESFIDNRKER